MSSYTPFDNKIRDLKASDLVMLQQAEEGWYIEYKSEVVKASALAKSVSAFANTYGGWLFLGIAEKSKSEPVAGNFQGIHRDEIDASLQRIRKALNDHVNPVPFFETKVLWGPEDSIGLEEDRAVICVWIPRSVATPHVHKNGVIYRRVSDSSEPRAENDRFVLDQLWRRADDLNRVYEKWHDRDPEFSNEEAEQPYLRIMIVADKWEDQEVYIESDESEIRRIFQGTEDSFGVPFDTVYSTSTGYLGRQINNNDLFHLGLTWKLGHDVSSDVLIPLPQYKTTSIDELKLHYIGYENVSSFISLLKKYNISNIRIVDLNYVLSMLIGVAKIQDKFCNLAKFNMNYHIKIKLLNVWRAILFIDTANVINRFDNYGIPMSLDKCSSYPNVKGYNGFIEIDRFSNVENEDERYLWQSLRFFVLIAKSFGLPYLDEFDEESQSFPYYSDLQRAAHRAMIVQSNRSERFKSGV